VSQQQTGQASSKEWQTPQQESKRRNKKSRQSLPQEKHVYNTLKPILADRSQASHQ
jgi:hypothetical protein